MKIEAFLAESPLIAVVWAARRFEAQLAPVFAKRSLNLSGALILVSVLLEEPNHVSPSELAASLSMTRGNVSHCIAALEGSGLVTRRLDPDDARAHHLVLKPDGKKIAMQVVRVLHGMQTSFEKHIGTTRLRDFIRVLKELEEEGTGGV